MENPDKASPNQVLLLTILMVSTIIVIASSLPMALGIAFTVVMSAVWGHYFICPHIRYLLITKAKD